MAHPMLDRAQWEDATPDESLVIADGPEITIVIRDGCLKVTDGPRKERIRVYPAAKQLRVIRHLVIVGNHGIVSLEAIGWLKDHDIPWMIINPVGTWGQGNHAPVLAGTSGGWIKPELQRKMAMAFEGGPLEAAGLQIAKRLITDKLRGQASVARNRFGNEDIAQYITNVIADVQACDSVKKIGGYEGEAAAAYWSLWKGLRPVWSKPSPIKPQWLAYAGRASLNYDDDSGKNRSATDPVNALLNYGYKCAESEATCALYALGLDPSMGISHILLASHRRRDAFALDLLEVLRPAVDSIVLDIVSEPMDKRLFTPDANDVVTVEAPLTHKIAARVHEAAYKLQPALNEIIQILTAS